MTQRELDARVASIQYTETTDLNLPAIEVAGDAFEAGVEWADGHPRWISVEDELPEKGDIVIVMQDAYGNIHFTACEFISAMQLCDVTDFHVRSDAYLGITKKAEITLGAVTHWMPTPQPPAVLSSLEITEKKWEEKKGGEQ